MRRFVWASIVLTMVIVVLGGSLSIVGSESSAANDGLYHSDSSSLASIIDAESPISNDDFTLQWRYIPPTTKGSNSSSVWTLTSTPLIVGDYVYIACGDTLYKLESDTGVPVVTTAVHTSDNYYRELGYGGGYIICYEDGQIFDLDLQYVCSIDPSILSVYYNDGYFYGVFTGSSDVVRKFSIDSGSVKYQTGLWKDATLVEHWYSSFGYVSPACFSDNMLYSLSTSVDSDGRPDKIYLNSINLTTGEYKTSDLGLDGWYLDDGYLTLYEGKIYLTIYSNGMFESESGPTDSRVVVIDMVSLKVDFYVNLEGYTGQTSQFVIYNGRGYVNVCATGVSATGEASLMVFDMKTFESNSKPIYTVSSVPTHGSIVLNTHYANASNGYKVYVYILPYAQPIDTSCTVFVLEDYIGCTAGKTTTLYDGSDYYSNGEYCSQAVRVGSDGQLIFYRDSGMIVSYTMESRESTPYYIFLEGNKESKWVLAYGSSAKSLVETGLIVVDESGDIVGYRVGEETVTSGYSLYAYNCKTEEWEEINPTLDIQLTKVGVSQSGGISYNYVPITDHYLVLSVNSAPYDGEIYKVESSDYYFSHLVGEDKSIIGSLLCKYYEDVNKFSMDIRISESDGIVNYDIAWQSPDSTLNHDDIITILLLSESAGSHYYREELILDDDNSNLSFDVDLVGKSAQTVIMFHRYYSDSGTRVLYAVEIMDKYTVEFKYSDGTIIDSRQYWPGEYVDAPEVLPKDGNNFVCWDSEVQVVSSDATYIALLENIDIKYIDVNNKNTAVEIVSGQKYLVRYHQFVTINSEEITSTIGMVADRSFQKPVEGSSTSVGSVKLKDNAEGEYYYEFTLIINAPETKNAWFGIIIEKGRTCVFKVNIIAPEIE